MGRFAEVNAVCVARSNFSGRYELYFYQLDGQSSEQVIQPVMAEFPDYTFEYGVQQDATWSHYFENLYPPPLDLQRMESRKTIERLAEAGDPLKWRREVSHHAVFPSELAARNFLGALAEHHFIPVSREVSHSARGEKQLKVTVKRVDRVDFNSIDGVVAGLLELAEQYHGSYLRWETEAVQAPEKPPFSDKLFRVQGEPWYGIYPGKDLDGNPAIAFVAREAYLVANFAADGTYLDHTLVEWQRPTVEPKDDSLEASSNTREQEHALVRQHLLANGFASLEPIEVKKFWVDGYAIGITQFPSHLQDALSEEEREFGEVDVSPLPEYVRIGLNIPIYPDEEELAELREWAEEWRARGDYVLWFGNDYYCSEDGEIHSS